VLQIYKKIPQTTPDFSHIFANFATRKGHFGAFLTKIGRFRGFELLKNL